MKQILIACCLFAVPVLAHAGKCSQVDIPVAFTISSTYTDPSTSVQYTAGIQPDGRGEYINGVDGVIALIHTCNGSNAVTVNMNASNGGTRTLTYDFTHAVNTTSQTPAWTATPVSTGNTFVSFSNLLYNYVPNSTASFTTYMNELYLPNVPNGPYYDVMENPLAVAPTAAPDAGLNTPCQTSLVNVVHYPATVNPAAPEHWVIWSDGSQPSFCNNGSFLQVSTLHFFNKGHLQNAGQFSLPFYMVVRRLQ